MLQSVEVLYAKADRLTPWKSEYASAVLEGGSAEMREIGTSRRHDRTWRRRIVSAIAPALIVWEPGCLVSGRSRRTFGPGASWREDKRRSVACNPRSSFYAFRTRLCTTMSSLETIATENAPTSVEALNSLLINDTKVKVAGIDGEQVWLLAPKVGS